MKAVILAGGKGTRLAPYTTIFPKPLVPLGNKPILDIVLHQLQRAGFNDITLSLGYLSELITAYMDHSTTKLNKDQISFVTEEVPLGTVGSLSLVDGLDDTFLTMNGDILTTLDYRKLIEFHKENKAMLTIAMNQRDVKIDLGTLKLEGNQIVNFQEKPVYHYNVSMGIYVYEPEILNYITPGEYFDFPQLVWKMLDKGDKICGYPSGDYWLDLGTPADYEKAQNDFESMKNQFVNWE